jgi:hypothetical protein
MEPTRERFCAIATARSTASRRHRAWQRQRLSARRPRSSRQC